MPAPVILSATTFPSNAQAMADCIAQLLARRAEACAQESGRSASTSSTATAGVSRTSIRSTADSTFGGGQNEDGGTVKRNRGTP